MSKFAIYFTQDAKIKNYLCETDDEYTTWKKMVSDFKCFCCKAEHVVDAETGTVTVHVSDFNQQPTAEEIMAVKTYAVTELGAANAVVFDSEIKANYNVQDMRVTSEKEEDPNMIAELNEAVENNQLPEVPVEHEPTPAAPATMGQYFFKFRYEDEHGQMIVGERRNLTYEKALTFYTHSVEKDVECYFAIGKHIEKRYIREKPVAKAVSAHGPVMKVEHEVKETPAFRGDYAFLSNMYESPIKLGGITYTCAEAAFQAAKLSDKNARAQFAGLTGPEAKKLGRQVTLRPDWEKIKLDVMRWVIHEKFAQNPQLAAKLKATGITELVENNGHNDTFWGRCDRKGQNWLGVILTEERMKIE